MSEISSGLLEALVAAGSQTNLAKAVGVTQQAVQQWVQRGYVPISKSRLVSMLYGIPSADLVNPAYFKNSKKDV